MKRILVLCALTLSMCAFAQPRLILQNQDPISGYTSLGTSDVIVRNGMADRHPLKVSILATQISDSWVYSLEIAVSEFTSKAIPEGGIFLIRTLSGNVYELANTRTEAESRDRVGTWIEGTSSKVYYNRASYPVTREQLEDISSGVSKIRMQLLGSTFDTEFKKDKLGAAVGSFLTLIDSVILSGSDIRSDF